MADKNICRYTQNPGTSAKTLNIGVKYMINCSTVKTSQKALRAQIISNKSCELFEHIDNILMPNLKSRYPNVSDVELFKMSLEFFKVVLNFEQ